MYRSIHIAALSALICAGVGYADETPQGEDAKKVTFDDHVKPIFRQHCVNCHNQGEAKGGLALDTMSAVIAGGASGEIVYANEVEGSRLWQLVAHEDTPVMPPNSPKIPQAEIDVIAAWINGGLLENMGSKAAKKKANNLSFVSVSAGKPEGPAAMPELVPQKVPVVTSRAAAITAIAASPWAPLVAVAGQKQISLYQSDTGMLLGILPFEEGIAQSLRFSRDGAYLVAGGGEHSFKGIAAIYDIKNGNRIATVGDELDVAFDADVNHNLSQVAMGGPQKMLRIYDTATGELQFDIKKHTDWIYAVAFSPDGVLIASGDRSGGLSVWEAATGRPYLDLNEHKGAINSISWRDDSNVFASASDDGTVKLWDVVEGKAVKTINAHGGGVTAVRFDHQGRLVTAGKDNRVKLWDAAGNLAKEFSPMSEAVLEAAITYDGARVVGGDWTGKVLITQVDAPDKSTEIAANPPTPQQRLEEVKAKIAAVQPQFDQTLNELNAAKGVLAEQTKKREQVQAEKQQKVAMAETAKQASQAEMAKAEQLKQEIPGLAAQTRDRHDQVIAARLGSLDAEAAQEDLAKKEAELAGVLNGLAQKRRDQIAARKMAAAKNDEANQLTAAAEAMNPAIASAEAEEAKAKAAADELQKRHQAVADEKSKLDQLAKQLTEAV